MLYERSNDTSIRDEAEEIINELYLKVHTATFYSGVSRIYLPERHVIMVATALDDDPTCFAQVDHKNGYYLIEMNFPALSRKIMGKEVRIRDLQRSSVRRYLSVFLKNNWFRSFLVHELVHVALAKKGSNYSHFETDEYRNWTINGKSIEAYIESSNGKIVILNTGSKTVRVRVGMLTPDDQKYLNEWQDATYTSYANNPEEVTAWLNQAVYDLVYRARGANIPERIIGHDAGSFTDAVVSWLDDMGMWGWYTERTRRLVRKRSYTGYQDVLRQIIS